MTLLALNGTGNKYRCIVFEWNKVFSFPNYGSCFFKHIYINSSSCGCSSSEHSFALSLKINKKNPTLQLRCGETSDNRGSTLFAKRFFTIKYCIYILHTGPLTIYSRSIIHHLQDYCQYFNPVHTQCHSRRC